MVKKRKLFCERGKFCYKISLIKEYLIRDIKDFFAFIRGERFAHKISDKEMPVIIKGHFSVIKRRLAGVDMRLQENKAVNLSIAAKRLNGLTIRPGEIFSFWRLVGNPTKSRGFVPGLTISGGRLGSAAGGGLCQMANLIHWLVLNSPLETVELHHHSDALFPDDGRRVPFGTGTSVFYKNVDYRFKNVTDSPVQIRVWIRDGVLYGELRGTSRPPCRYLVREEGHCFVKESDGFYRCSRVYRDKIDRKSGEVISTELILCNHSKVMYDFSLIPKEEISVEAL